MEDNRKEEFDTGLEKVQTIFRETQKEKENLGEELMQLRKDHDELIEEIVGLKSEQKQLRESNKDHKETEEALLEEVQHLKKEREAASSASNVEEDIQAKDQEIAALLTTNEQLHSDNDELRSRLKEQEETVRTLQNRLAQVSQEKQNIEKRHATTIQNVDVLKKQYTDEVRKQQGEVKLWREREAAKSTLLKKQEEQNLELRKWMKKTEREGNDLKKQVVALQKQRGTAENETEMMSTTVEERVSLTKGMAIGSMDVVVLEQSYQDKRVQHPLRQLLEDKLEKTIISLVASAIEPQYESQLVITCVPNHKEIEIDLRQALDAAKLGLMCPIVVIFHHLAPHRCPRVPLASARRVADGALLKRSRALVDIVYWNTKIYDCDINAESVAQLRDLLAPEAEAGAEQQQQQQQQQQEFAPTPTAAASTAPLRTPPPGAVPTPFHAASQVPMATRRTSLSNGGSTA